MVKNKIIEKFLRDGYLNISREVFLNDPIDKVFNFFSDASNLDILTPRWLNFNIITEMPISISKDTHISYQLKYRGFPIKWISNISEWDPPYFFVDEQIKGPYKKWVHFHYFKSQNQGTVVTDIVFYKIIGNKKIDTLLDSLIIKSDLDKIFDFRMQMIKTIDFQNSKSSL
tara:strand:+ start:999 stop:1511 length:513 start_codon:yes stop_codon:yes gene_type:complete